MREMNRNEFSDVFERNPRPYHLHNRAVGHDLPSRDPAFTKPFAGMNAEDIPFFANSLPNIFR
jgi:hypothetical protein